MFSLAFLLFACSGADTKSSSASSKKTTQECPTCPECPKGSDASLSAAEQELLSNSIEDLRAGIRGFDQQSIGVCRGSGKNCETFLGKEALDLPEGTYILYAKLTAPKIKKGKGWKVDYKKECTITKKTKNGESVTNNTYSKEYDGIVFSKKGFRLAPLATIKSPGKYGQQECQWKLTFHNVNGTEEISGKWSVPAAKTP